jgi:hypothetical protein
MATVDNVVDKPLERSADPAQILCISAPQLTSLESKVNLTNSRMEPAQLLENMTLFEIVPARAGGFSTGASKAADLLTSPAVDK